MIFGFLLTGTSTGLALSQQRGDVIFDLAGAVPTKDLARFCLIKDLNLVTAGIACANTETVSGAVEALLQLRSRPSSAVDSVASSPIYPPDDVGTNKCVILPMHAMNPGLVCYCIQRAVRDLADRIGCMAHESGTCDLRTKGHAHAMNPGLGIQKIPLSSLAREIGLSDIDITEVDTQAPAVCAGTKTFVTTWSPTRMFEEMVLAEAQYTVTNTVVDHTSPHKEEDTRRGPNRTPYDVHVQCSFYPGALCNIRHIVCRLRGKGIGWGAHDNGGEIADLGAGGAGTTGRGV